MWFLHFIGIAVIVWVLISVFEDASEQRLRDKFNGRQKNNREK